MFIKKSTRKVLWELDKIEKWRDSLFSIEHETGFEIFQPEDILWIRLWKQPISWNILEKFLVWRKARKIKRDFLKPQYDLHPFFK